MVKDGAGPLLFTVRDFAHGQQQRMSVAKKCFRNVKNGVCRHNSANLSSTYK